MLVIGLIYGILIGLVLGMAIYREGYLFYQEKERRAIKHEEHLRRVAEYEKRKVSGRVDAWIR